MKLELYNIGQLKHAMVEFGDLTVLVGPQASGKSIFLQFFKLCEDTWRVISDLRKQGQDWSKNFALFLELYLGEGMSALWNNGNNGSRVIKDQELIDLEERIAHIRPGRKIINESLFFIPAQRVLALNQQGWWRHFGDYRPVDPYVVRAFSETIRLLMEGGFGSEKGGGIFPQKKRLKSEIKKKIDQAVFHGFQLTLDYFQGQKRLTLKSDVSKNLPFMVWSAGQREFVPLLLGLYWLLPPSKVAKRRDVNWIVIEELEMGLHPKAISAVMLTVLDLISRGYKVVLSTHSPHILDILWGIRNIQKRNASSDYILDMFNLKKTPSTKKLAELLFTKEYRSYFFDTQPRKNGSNSLDITELDPGAEDSAVAGWGGLSEFSGHIADVVAQVVSQSNAGQGHDI